MLRPITWLTVVALWPAATACLAGCGAASGQVRSPGADHFAKVRRRDDPGSYFYRGGQPTERGIGALKQAGVKSVMDLRDDFDPREERWARDAGMDYVLIKTNCREIEPLKIATFMGKMRQFQNDPDRWPVFVHCDNGRDRTGLYVAVWRIVEEGWDRNAAIDELIRNGHNPNDPRGCTQIVPYLRRFDAAPLRASQRRVVHSPRTASATAFAKPLAPKRTSPSESYAGGT